MVDSPCVKICELNSSDVCVGCGRTRAEIGVWSSAPERQKTQIIELAARRKRELDQSRSAKPSRRG